MQTNEKGSIMHDWYVVLEPHNDPDWRGPGALEIVHGEEEDAIDALEHWAFVIEACGYVPDSLDWRNQSPCAVVKRAGKRSYRVRCDSFERETETGMTNGAGWLRVRVA